MLTSATFCMAFTSVQLHTQGQHCNISADQVQKNFDIILIKFSVGISWL